MSILRHFGDMVASSQAYQKKRKRDEYWNDRFALPNEKRMLADESALMPLLNKIDNMDNNGSNPENTVVRMNGVINSLENEIMLKAQTDHNIDPADEMGLIREGQLTADLAKEATPVTPYKGKLTDFDDVRAELGFLADLITPQELGIIINHIHGDSVPHVMDSYSQTTEVFYASLWEDDTWHLNEYPVLQDHLESPQPETLLVESSFMPFGATTNQSIV